MEQLLQRYIRGKVSEEERLKVVSWLDENPDNMREFLALRKLYDISLWHTDTEQKTLHKKFIPTIRRIAIETLKIAAIFLIGIFVTKQFVEQKVEDIQIQTIHVPTGQRAELTLADGTHVWLNSRSTLKFPNKFGTNKRNVELNGEGYFSVHHDKKRPFTVQTEKYAIHVLGTEFNVKAYHNSPLFETALLNGSVEISSLTMPKRLRLKPNEMAIASQEGLNTSHIPDYNYFKWKEGLFCFEDESIQSLIEKLQLYYDIKIDVQRPSLLQYRYSGKFRIKDGIDHVLKVLQLKHKFTYTKNEETNLIVIK